MSNSYLPLKTSTQNQLEFTKEQQEFITNLKDNIFLQAVPGAGKTTTMLHKIYFILQNKPTARIQYISFNNRLAINFGNKLISNAPQNLRKRIQKQVHVNTLHSLLYKKFIQLFPDAILYLNTQSNQLTTTYQESALQYVTFKEIEQFFIQNPSEALELFKGIDYLFIDEVQDLHPNLLNILNQVFRHRIVINAVGDMNQTIYQFAGADIKELTNFSNNFNIIINHTTTYRLKEPITCFLNILFNQNMSSYRDPGKGPHTIKPYNANNQAQIILVGTNNKHTQTLFLKLLLQKWNIEQSNIAEQTISRKHKLIPFSIYGKDIAILLRTNQQVNTLHNFLSKASIPAVKLPYFLTTELKYLGTLNEELNNILNTLTTNKTIKDLAPYITKFKELAVKTNNTRIPKQFLNDLQNITYVSELSLWLYNVQSFLNQLPYSGGINLSTIHQAKGLEFDTVIIPYTEYLDITKISSDNELRNLLYVALTRSKTELIILAQKDSATYKIIKDTLRKLQVKNNLASSILILENLSLNLPKQQRLI